MIDFLISSIYLFRADQFDLQFFSAEENHCTVPECTTALVITLGMQQVEVNQTIDYTYDPLNRLTNAVYDDGSFYQYTYDAVGNRLTETTPAGTDTYIYNNNNWVVQKNDTSWSYDAAGNLRSDGIRSYDYDAANRLKWVSDQSAYVQTSYAYNGLGDRLQSTLLYYPTGESTTTNYTLDLNTNLTQVLADGSNTYTYGYNRIAQVSETQTGYFLGDALGSVRQVADDTGSVNLVQSYSPYGEVIASVGSYETVFSYTGEMTDATGLVFLRARYYDPATGRFVNKDTWGGDYNNPITLAKWLYANGNPLIYSDPSGQKVIPRKQSIINNNPYSRFDKTLEYIYNEMLTNSQGESAELMRSMLKSDNDCANYGQSPEDYLALQVGKNLGAYYLFYLKVKTGNEWDHKPKIKAMLNVGNTWNDLYFPIRGNNDYEVYYDIWSNIHYGYVGASIGIDRNTLQFFANMEMYTPDFLKKGVRRIFGQYDPGDVISVDIGVRLWQDHRFSISKSNLQSEILSHMSTYFISQDINGNGAIDNSEEEINPIVGKLLPRNTEWSDWQ